MALVVSGRVTGPSAASVPNVGVSAETVDGSDNGAGARTNADGLFTFRVLPGTYRLHFRPNDPITTLVDQYWNNQLPVLQMSR